MAMSVYILEIQELREIDYNNQLRQIKRTISFYPLLRRFLPAPLVLQDIVNCSTVVIMDGNEF